MFRQTIQFMKVIIHKANLIVHDSSSSLNETYIKVLLFSHFIQIRNPKVAKNETSHTPGNVKEIFTIFQTDHEGYKCNIE